MIKTLRKFAENPAFLSVGLCFAIHSILFAFWYTRLPWVMKKLDLSEGEIGLILFFLPLGSIIAMLACSYLINRWGEGKVTIFTFVGFALSMFFPLLSPDTISLSISLFFVGAFAGAMDIAMNAVVTTLEKKYQTAIMSASHGFWSLGGMVGALIGSAILGYNIEPEIQIGASFIIILLLIFFFLNQHTLVVRGEHAGGGSGLSLPSKSIIGLAMVGFCIMMGEGAIADWSTVYMDDYVKAGPFLSGYGYAGFSFCMTLGRFFGDELIMKRGAISVVRFGSLLAMIGLGVVLIEQTYATIIGFGLVGLGYSCIVPVLFSSSAKVPGVTPSEGIASVASSGFIGILLGPVLIGLIAEASSLGTGFLFILVLTFLAMISTPYFLPKAAKN